MEGEKDYYQKSVDEILDELDTSREGLDRDEAKKRLKKHGLFHSYD